MTKNKMAEEIKKQKISLTTRVGDIQEYKQFTLVKQGDVGRLEDLTIDGGKSIFNFEFYISHLLDITGISESLEAYNRNGFLRDSDEIMHLKITYSLGMNRGSILPILSIFPAREEECLRLNRYNPANNQKNPENFEIGDREANLLFSDMKIYINQMPLREESFYYSHSRHSDKTYIPFK